jgi:hypothetical protein
MAEELFRQHVLFMLKTRGLLSNECIELLFEKQRLLHRRFRPDPKRPKRTTLEKVAR